MNEGSEKEQNVYKIDMPVDDNLMELVDELTKDDKPLDPENESYDVSDGNGDDDILDLEEEVTDSSDDDILELEDPLSEELPEDDEILDLEESVSDDNETDDDILDLEEEVSDFTEDTDDEILDLEMTADELAEEGDDDILDLEDELADLSDSDNDELIDIGDEADSLSEENSAAASDFKDVTMEYPEEEEDIILDLDAEAGDQEEDEVVLDLEDEVNENGDIVLDLGNEVEDESNEGDVIGLADAFDQASAAFSQDDFAVDSDSLVSMTLADLKKTKEEDRFSSIRQPDDEYPLNENIKITERQVDAALERVIKKMFAERIDEILTSLIDKSIIKELKLLQEKLLGKADEK